MLHNLPSSQSLSAAAADWTAAFSLDSAPPEVIESTKLRILDVIGVMIATSPLPLVHSARRAAADSEGSYGDARALIGPGTMAPAGAAFVNGVLSAVLEFDDTHIKSNIHPTGVVLSAALQECERAGLGGRDLIDSMLVGSELLCRLGMVSPVRMHEVGFHPTSAYGIFGAVYGLARLRRLSPRQIIDAIGAAGSLSAGSISSFQDGTSTKTLHVGFAAAAAVRAVGLATQGISGPYHVYEGRFGWFRSHFQEVTEFQYSALLDRLGHEWEVLNIASKLYPCAFTLMPFIAAAISLREEHGVQADDVEAIFCNIMPRSFSTVCEPVEEKRRPLTSWHGRISLQHTVAEALVIGQMDKNAYDREHLENPVIQGLADKVVHIEDPIAASDLSRSRGTVRIRLKGGREVAHTIEDMPGTRTNPISEADYVAKFRANVAGVISETAADELIQSLLALEQVKDLSSIFRALRPNT